MPGWFTVGFQVFCPVVKLPPVVVQLGAKVVPGSGGNWPMISVVSRQVRVAGNPGLAPGGATSRVTKIVSLLLHPLAVFRMVRMYIPAESTVGIRVLVPVTKCPPTVVQLSWKPKPDDEVLALMSNDGVTQVSWPGEAMLAVGGWAWVTTTLVEVGQIPPPLTVTL